MISGKGGREAWRWCREERERDVLNKRGENGRLSWEWPHGEEQTHVGEGPCERGRQSPGTEQVQRLGLRISWWEPRCAQCRVCGEGTTCVRAAGESELGRGRGRTPGSTGRPCGEVISSQGLLEPELSQESSGGREAGEGHGAEAREWLQGWFLGAQLDR